ncbi:hypothetical protein [Lactobacillus sp. CBA3605] [Lactiplantibacillus mudanjiangensis]|uniref:hypothetical protein n=1 Tax=Lactiplantibacillus mudanjiangensis TaxID=1296538 RepID=UPI001015085F|nr:hypothetical protein [Lactiplantibacillus mudanjiangensis]VDG31695.1 hypothetical protein [Lactobacillus sp. CBA3605] [Lactiplantibacillus mudanjiangensis]
MRSTNRFWTLNRYFATSLLVIGSGLILWALLTSFGTLLSVEATVTAGVLGIAALAFLQPAPLSVLAPTIAIISLSAGYATFFSTNTVAWGSAILAIVMMAGILSYGFNLRQALRRRHSQWQ